MYEYIKGKYKGINKDYIIVENNGIGYKIFTSGATMSSMPKIDEEISGTYADYKEIRKEKRKPIPYEGLIVATIFLIVAISCFIAYYQV